MKYALIIGNNKYDDPKLAQLKTPAADSAALAKVLDDKTIGSFDQVTSLVNQSESKVRRAVSAFLTEKKPDDLVLLYFSGHGVLDDRGRLYLALKDTQVSLLKATSIPSSFVADEMDSCRSRRQILVLDCCHSGAFARGTKGEQEQKAITETTFEGSGFGRVVLTASDSTQYALEGDQVIRQTELSLFTHFLLEGLKTGEADVNNDGFIALDEWYDYTYTKVVAETPRQVPHKWSYNQQGDLIIARNPFLKKKAVELPYELIQALESPFVGIRESAVIEVGKYLKSRDSEMVDLAISSLEKMKNDDSRRISLLAEKLLSEFEQARLQTNKATSPKTTIPEIVKASNDELAEMPRKSTGIETSSPAKKQIQQPQIARESISVDNSIPFQKSIFNASFWFKWIGISILGMIVSAMLVDVDISLSLGDYVYSSYFLIIAFGLVAGGLSFIQWLLFRDRLAAWWITANAAVGVIFSLMHRSLALNGWNHLSIFLAAWLIGNFVLGVIFMGKAQEKPRNFSSLFSSKRATQFGELEERRPDQKSERFAFDSLFWSKWAGTLLLVFIAANAVYYYMAHIAETSDALGIVFCIPAGLTAVAQWLFFRDRLEVPWISLNVAAGFILGSLQRYLYNTISGWNVENLRILLFLWIIGNIVISLILIRRNRQNLKSPPAINTTGARQNIFLLALSIFLLFFAFDTLINTFNDNGIFSTPDSLRNISWIIYGLLSLFAGLSF